MKIHPARILRFRAWSCGLALLAGCMLSWPASAEAPPMTVLVMDPLAADLACPCVEGYAQRDYRALGTFLTQQLKRPVEIRFAEAVPAATGAETPFPALIIGKDSVIRFDAHRKGVTIRPLARLTDLKGQTTLTGLFVVRSASPLQTLADLRGKRIQFGPEASAEKHGAARKALADAGVSLPAQVATSLTCNDSAVVVDEGDADAGVISSYALPLVTGCKVIPEGVLRCIGETAPLPFITVYATTALPADDTGVIRETLEAVRTQPALLKQLESRDGFQLLPTPDTAGTDWPDWRGRGRTGFSPGVPAQLPDPVRVRWRIPLTGNSLAGVAVTASQVLVADKDAAEEMDIFRCLHAETGRPLWEVRYRAAGEMDFTNAPRATPVVKGDLAYLLGAFGDLRCVRIEDGSEVWKRNLIRDFDAEPVTWGMCATPLVVDDKIIVNPGAKQASVVALDRFTGAVRWQSPGAPAAYASFILAELGGHRQVVGYDEDSVGGWDPESGKRLWRLVPEQEGDFNVPTPMVYRDGLLLSTENNGTRWYPFDRSGQPPSEPAFQNELLAPDTMSPVLCGGLLFGAFESLVCLDPAQDLQTCWEQEDDAFGDYLTLIAGTNHLLALTAAGELILIPASAERCAPVARRFLFEEEVDIWAHPALAGSCLYVRAPTELVCFELFE